MDHLQVAETRLLQAGHCLTESHHMQFAHAPILLSAIQMSVGQLLETSTDMFRVVEVARAALVLGFLVVAEMAEDQAQDVREERGMVGIEAVVVESVLPGMEDQGRPRKNLMLKWMIIGEARTTVLLLSQRQPLLWLALRMML